MAFFDIFRKTAKTEIVDEQDDEIESKKAYNRSTYRAMQERKHLELENIKLEAAKRREELEDELDEIRHEREVRRLEREVRMQEALERLQPEEEEIEGDSPETLLISLLSRVMNKAPSQSPAQVVENPPKPVTFSPEKVKNIWDGLSDTEKAIAKRMTDEQIRDYLINQIPNIDKDSIEKAIAVVRA